MKTFSNPILPGFYPDPSICRVGEDYYLVTSTFAYFPGVPIFHSKDLVHWKQIGNILDRACQLPLTGAETSRGIFAPTLRYHQGVFYMLTTNVSSGGNFVVTATDPAGPWSDPHYIKGAAGIDPSIFFDDDGKAYYHGTKERREGNDYFGDNEIYLQEIDLQTFELKGESVAIFHTALKNAVWPEAPHIYKKDGYYYLLLSEGGTAHDHAVTIARSETINGYYTGFKSNPILTHRHLGKQYKINCVGHGDLVETPAGDWYMVVLACRPYGNLEMADYKGMTHFRNLGRETFLVPVSWEDGWPVVNMGIGLVEEVMPFPNLVPHPVADVLSGKDDFIGDKLAYKYMHLRNPIASDYSLSEKPSYLTMKLNPHQITELEPVSFVALRQQHKNFVVETAFEFEPQQTGESAGLVLYQSHKYHIQFLHKKGKLEVIGVEDGKAVTYGDRPFQADKVSLKIISVDQLISFHFSENGGENYQCVAEGVDARMLSTDVAQGFVGTTIGMYATSHGALSENKVHFDYLDYRGIGDVPSLAQAYKDYFMIGTAIEPLSLTGARWDFVKKHFNAVTAENCMKPIHIQAEKGNFTFEKADQMVAQITENNITMIGHTLAWHQQSPEWLAKGLSREEAIANLETHIKTLMTRYIRKVQAWDVINEAFSDDIDDPTNWRAALRPTKWLEAIGEDYLEIVFNLAAKYDPNAMLYYNDYNLNYPKKREATYHMVKELKEKGVKITGIGMQGHYNASTNPQEVEDSINRFRELGVKISFTELDITVNHAQGQDKLTERNHLEQAILYARIFEILKRNSDIIERVTLWGVEDETSWRRSMFPLLFNREEKASPEADELPYTLVPKPAFWAVLDPEKFLANHQLDGADISSKEAVAVYGTPTGENDPQWDSAQPIAVNQFATAWNGATGQAQALWDETHLHLRFNILDPVLNADHSEPHQQDSIEVFLDEQDNKSFYYEADDAHYRVSYQNKQSFGKGGKAEHITSFAKVINGGYVIQMSIKWHTIAPVKGAVIGFEAQINDAGAGGTRESIARFNDTSDQHFQSTAKFGRLRLN